MDFGEVLSSAWRIVWRHRVLWIFGILAGCGSGGGGGGGGSRKRWQQSSPFAGGTGDKEHYLEFAYIEFVWGLTCMRVARPQQGMVAAPPTASNA